MTAEFDVDAVSGAVAEAIAGPGGIFLGVNVFASVPGVVHTPARRGFLRSVPERVQIGDWRYEVARDGRLAAAHVVNDIVIADEVLDAVAIGPHVARALAQLVGRFGPAVLPSIDAAVDALITGSGRH